MLLEEKQKHGQQVLALADAEYTAKFDPKARELYAPEAGLREALAGKESRWR